jgi:hypothetical protein
MMRKLLLGLPFLFLALNTSCEYIEDAARMVGLVDSLGYRYEYLTKEMGKCSDGNSACAKFDYRGVLFTKGATDSVLRAIETDLTQFIIQSNGSEATSLNDFIFANLKRYDAFITDFPKYDVPWEWRITQQVNYNKNKFIGISTLEYSYTGGDAGITQIFFRNYDIVTGSPLKYNKLFNAGFEDALKPIVKSKLQKAVPKEVWAKTNEDDNLGLLLAANNFRFSDEGLVMLFTPILDSKFSGPYEVLLPWKELTGILRPNFEKRLL